VKVKLIGDYMEKVDVVLLTYNCVSHWPGRRVLELCLQSIVSNIPINKIIIVDGGSTDGTLEVICRYLDSKCINYYIIEDKYGTRASSRMLGIKAVETDYFIFVDTDCILCPGWYSKIRKCIRDNVGAVVGRDVPVILPRRHLEARMKVKRRFGKVALPKTSRKKAFTGNTLILKEAIEGIKIPSYLHVGEDEYIRRFIESKGYKWIICNDAWCLHITKLHKPRDAYYQGISSYLFKTLTLKRLMLHVVTSIPKFTLVGYPDVGVTVFKLSLLRLLGYLKGMLCVHEELWS